MNYYNLSILTKSIQYTLRKSNQESYFELCPFRYKNFRSDRDTDLKFSKENTYVSEKEVFFQLMDYQEILTDLGCSADLSKTNISRAMLSEEKLKREGHFIDYKGPFDQVSIKMLKKKAIKEIKMNPYYFYFKNLNEISQNKEKCISIDFEFSVTHGPTEMGATYYENGNLTTKWYRVKGTPDRKKPSNHNKEAEMVDIDDLKEVLKSYHKKFDTFIFHDYIAEKKIINKIFGGLKGTPFDGKKKIIDTLRASQYIRQRDEEYNNSGFNDTLKGMCESMGVKATGFHNAANDTRFTMNVANQLANKYRKLWSKYVDRDISDPKVRKQKISI